MLTRGRDANHLYLQVVGDGDPHSIIRPEAIAPDTPTETVRQILGRDGAPLSASSLLRGLNDPAARLFWAVQRYTDSLHVAAEQLAGPPTVAELDQADQYLPGLTSEPGWPTLRAHLLTLAAETGAHPLRHLQGACSGHDLRTAGDMAAVLDCRLPTLTLTNTGPRRSEHEIAQWAESAGSASDAAPRPGNRFPTLAMRALVEQRGCAAPRKRRQDLHVCAVALCTTCLAPPRIPPARTVLAWFQIRCIRGAGWERK